MDCRPYDCADKDQPHHGRQEPDKEVLSAKPVPPALQLGTSELEQSLRPHELDGPDGEPGEDDQPAGPGKGDEDDADGDHDGADKGDRDLNGDPPGAGGTDSVMNLLQLLPAHHASLQP